MGPAQDRARGVEGTIQTLDSMQELRFWGLWGLAVIALVMLPRCISAWRGTAMKHIETNQRKIIKALRKKHIL